MEKVLHLDLLAESEQLRREGKANFMMAEEGGEGKHLVLEGVNDLIAKIEYPFLNGEMSVLIVKVDGLVLLVEVMEVDEKGMID